MNTAKKQRIRRSGLTVAPPPKKRSAIAEFFACVREWWRAFLIVYDLNIKTVTVILWTIVVLIPIVWWSGILSRNRIEIVIIDCRVTNCNQELHMLVKELRDLRK